MSTIKLKTPSEESYQKIEGEWKKDFRFRRILPSDYEAVLQHNCENFLKDERISELFGYDQEFADDSNRVFEYYLKQGMSFLLEHVPTGKIAAVRITFVHTPQVDEDLEALPINTWKGEMMTKLLVEVLDRADIQNRHGIDTWAEFSIQSTSREFRNMGIANEFYDRSFAFLKAEGYKHIVVILSSPITRRATAKRGFVEQSKMEFKELMDENGCSVFKDEALNEEDYAVASLKTL